MPLRDILAALVVTTLWGLNFSAIKVAVDAFPPLFMSGVRFGLVAVLLGVMTRVPWRHLKSIAVLSVTFGFFHFGVLAIALTRVDSAAGAILMQLNVPFAVLLAALFLGDSFGKWRTVGLVIAFIGAAFLAGEPKASEQPWALALVVVSAFGWGVGQVHIKRMTERLGPIDVKALNAWLAVFLTPQLFILSAFFETGQFAAAQSAGLWGWGGVAYQVLGASVAAYGLWYYLLARHAVSTVAPFNLLVPVIGVMGGVLVLGETLTWEKAVGGLITLAGVSLIQYRLVKKSD